MERNFRITVDGRAFNVTVEDLSEAGNTLYPSPGSMQVPLATSVAAPLASITPTPNGTPSAGAVVSSLGGVVESVHVSVGQVLAAGDKVVTIEAMKMKNVIVASSGGTVRVVAVKLGDTVDAGQVLVELG